LPVKEWRKRYWRIANRVCDLNIDHSDWKLLFQDAAHHLEIFKLMAQSAKNPMKTRKSLMEVAKHGCEEVKNWIAQTFK
jgi:hypothetical protein